VIDIADTTFRAYKKKRGGISLHLRSYLLVHTNVGFKLSAYLKDIRAWIRLPGGKEEEIDSVAISEHLVYKFSNDIMAHDLWLSTLIHGCDVKRCTADLRVMYHISFTGHPAEEPQFIQRKVLVIPRFYDAVSPT
jgi:hypothetical protein